MGIGHKVTKYLFAAVLLSVVILYDVWPIDAFPGPIDDVIVTLLGIIVARKKLKGD